MSNEHVIKLVYRKDFDGLRRAIAHEANLNAVDEDGRTLLMHAVLATDADSAMVRFLVANGANPNAADAVQQWTALHFAARDQKLLVVQALLEGGAVVDAEDSFGNTPLWRCVMAANPNSELVRLLMGRGANPRKKNRHGSSPRDIAERTGKQELLALFC
jgi:ankyrin repeat protein